MAALARGLVDRQRLHLGKIKALFALIVDRLER
jgi:hypothetical protein